MSIKEQNVVITSKDELNNTVIYKPYTDVSMVEGAVSSINNIVPDSNGNVTIDVPNTDSFAKKEDVYLYVGNDTPTKLTENLIVLNPNETQNVVMPTIKIGTVTTGTTSKVVNRGTYLNPILDFTLEKGEKGDNGEVAHASSYIASVTESNGKVIVTRGDGVTNSFSSGLNILGRNKEYAVGDIAYSPNLPSWAYLECITAGTTGDTEPTFTTGGVILNQEITDNTVVFKLRNIGLLSYPIGSIYQSTNSTNPSNIFGGIWSQIKDRFLLACGDNYANGSVGGEASHTLTINEIPSHNHNVSKSVLMANNSGVFTINDSNFDALLATDNAPSNFGVFCTDAQKRTILGNTGGSSAHNNMPPYFAIYTWYRTA